MMSMWLNSAGCVDVGRSSVVGPKASHEVRPTVQRVFVVWEPLGSPCSIAMHCTIDCKVGKQIDFRELVNGTLLRIALI